MLTKNSELIKKSRLQLEEIFRSNIDLYIDLFFYEKEVELSTNQAGILYKAGIIRQINNKWVANVMVFPFRRKFIVTDFLLSIYRKRDNIFTRQVDDVWPMYPFETLAFINSLMSNLNNDTSKNKLALDLASGSGAIGLFLAEKFKKVISADINPKAVRYAHFNTVLNNLEHKIINIQSDIFKSLKRYKFDYIAWNGPTGAFPDVDNPKKYYPQYIYGGADGTKFTRKFLDNVFNHLTDDFKIKFLDCSLGDNKESLTVSYIKSKFSDFPIEVKIEFLNKNGKQLLRNYQRLYDKYCVDRLPMNLTSDNVYKKAVQEWEEYLKNKKLNYFYFSYVSILPSSKFQINFSYPKKSYFLPRHNFGFEWHFTSREFIKKYLLGNIS